MNKRLLICLAWLCILMVIFTIGVLRQPNPQPTFNEALDLLKEKGYTVTENNARKHIIIVKWYEDFNRFLEALKDSGKQKVYFVKFVDVVHAEGEGLIWFDVGSTSHQIKL